MERVVAEARQEMADECRSARLRPVWTLWSTVRGEVRMSEFLQNYGFFILVAILMVVCHLGHGRHGGHGRDGDDKGQSGGGHQH
jgi:hypothetical protein